MTVVPLVSLSFLRKALISKKVSTFNASAKIKASFCRFSIPKQGQYNTFNFIGISFIQSFS